MFPLTRYTRGHSREKTSRASSAREFRAVSKTVAGNSGMSGAERKSHPFSLLLFSMTAALATALLLGSGCSGDNREAPTNTAQQPIDEGRPTSQAVPSILTVLCKPEYLPEALLDDFTAQTGIVVVIADPADHPDLTAGDGSFDLALIDSRSLSTLLDQELLAKIDRAAIPNSIHISLPFSADPVDPNGTFSVPFLWGTLGIVVNRSVVTDPDIEWGILFDHRFAEKIDMPDDIRLLLDAALRNLGTFLGEADSDALNRAADLLYEQRKIVRGYFQVSEIIDHLAENSSYLSCIDGPSAFRAIQKNQALEYIVPASGAPLWLMVWVIPAASENADAALHLIDFVLDVKRIAAVSNANRIANTVADSKPYLDDTLIKTPAVILTADLFARCRLSEPIDLETENFMMRLRDDFMLK